MFLIDHLILFVTIFSLQIHSVQSQSCLYMADDTVPPDSNDFDFKMLDINANLFSEQSSLNFTFYLKVNRNDFTVNSLTISGRFYSFGQGDGTLVKTNIVSCFTTAINCNVSETTFGKTHQDLLNRNLSSLTIPSRALSQIGDQMIYQLQFGFLSREKVSYIFKFTGIRLDGYVFTKDITQTIGYDATSTSLNKYVNNGKLTMPVSMICNARNAQEQLCIDILTQQKQQIYQNTTTITNWLTSANKNNLFDSLSITGNSQNLLTTSSAYLETKQQTSLTTTTTIISVQTGDEKNNSEKTTIAKTEQKSTDTLSIQTNNANKKQLFLKIKLILLSILFIGFMY